MFRGFAHQHAATWSVWPQLRQRQESKLPMSASHKGMPELRPLSPEDIDNFVLQVRLDGHDLGMYDHRWLKRRVGIVSQEPTLYGRRWVLSCSCPASLRASGLSAGSTPCPPCLASACSDASQVCHVVACLKANPLGYSMPSLSLVSVLHRALCRSFTCEIHRWLDSSSLFHFTLARL